MKHLFARIGFAGLVYTVFGFSALGDVPSAPSAAGLYRLDAVALDGSKAPLSSFAGKPSLFVNVASRCGYTPQYDGLQALYAKYRDQGFSVLGFPSNDFGGQEPGSNKEIATFCKLKYGVTFPLFAKGPVSGPGKQPVYRELLARAPKDERGEVQWNFEKFLVDGNGQVVARFRSGVEPLDPALTKQVEALLARSRLRGD